MLTRGKKQKSDQTEQIDMAEPDKSDGRGVTTLDDLLKEIKKNQKTTETIQEQLNSIQSSVDANTATLDSHIKVYNSEVKTLNEKIKLLDNTVNTLDEKYNAVTVDMKELKQENTDLRKRMYEAEGITQRFIGLEQEAKRRNIIIDGIKEAPFHKTKSEVASLLGELDIEASNVTVVNMYRLGKLRADKKQPRPVMVKLQSNMTKQTLYKNIANLKDNEKWARISIRDDVSEETQDIQRDLRCIAASARSKGHRAQVRG